MLLASEGWERLAKMVQSLRLTKRNQILGGSGEGLNGLVEDAKVRSELAGIEFLFGVPQQMVEDLQLEVDAVLEELRMDEEVPHAAD